MALYGIHSNGNLLWNSHDGRDDGSQRWTGPKGVGLGGWKDYRSNRRRAPTVMRDALTILCIGP